MTRYGVRVDGRHRGYTEFTVWSGSFMSTYEGLGILRDGAKRTTVTTYNDDRVPVIFPEGVRLPRTDENYEEIDRAINDALNAYERERGSVQMIPDIPADAPPLDEIPDPPAPGADDR